MMLHELIRKTLLSLSTYRPVFFSEADFQFAFAWELQKTLPAALVRLEYCPTDIDPSMHVDILIRQENEWFPIELKYMTLGCNIDVNEEKYVLKSQGAQDIRRYDLLKDIMRLERLVLTDKRFKIGFAILISNDPSYWSSPRTDNTCDADFRITEGIVKSGVLKWAEHTGKGTSNGREMPINLKGKYNMSWNHYSKISDARWGQLRSLLVEVNPLNLRGEGLFYVYENWVAEKKAVIHKASCSHCNYGEGTHRNIRRDQNGKWHGSFESFEEAESLALSLKDRKVKYCGHCNSENK